MRKILKKVVKMLHLVKGLAPNSNDDSQYCRRIKKKLNKGKMTSCAVLDATHNNILGESAILLNKESTRSF